MFLSNSVDMMKNLQTACYINKSKYLLTSATFKTQTTSRFRPQTTLKQKTSSIEEVRKRTSTSQTKIRTLQEKCEHQNTCFEKAGIETQTSTISTV